MKKQAVHREYNFPDADLYAQCMERIRYATRDLSFFESYAYNKTRLEAFKKRCAHFATLPTDEELLGDQMLATEKKNIQREATKSAIRSIMTRVATKFNSRSGRYRKFGTQKMGDMSDAKLLLCGRRVARVAEQQIHFLQETGLNNTHIDQLRQAVAAFELALHIQQDKVADRDIAVEKRVEVANEIYEELVMLCNIGKDIWAETNKAKYENYTLYESNNEQKKARKAKQNAEKKNVSPNDKDV